MSFATKEWKNDKAGGTKLNAAGVIDLEKRVTNYTDDVLEANGKGYVNHGAMAGTARPSGYASVEWMGSVEPEHKTSADTWIVTP